MKPSWKRPADSPTTDPAQRLERSEQLAVLATAVDRLTKRFFHHPVIGRCQLHGCNVTELPTPLPRLSRAPEATAPHALAEALAEALPALEIPIGELLKDTQEGALMVGVQVTGIEQEPSGAQGTAMNPGVKPLDFEALVTARSHLPSLGIFNFCQDGERVRHR